MPLPLFQLAKPDLIATNTFTLEGNVRSRVVYERKTNMDSVVLENRGTTRIYWWSSKDLVDISKRRELDPGDWLELETDVRMLSALNASVVPNGILKVTVHFYSKERLDELEKVNTSLFTKLKGLLGFFGR